MGRCAGDARQQVKGQPEGHNAAGEGAVTERNGKRGGCVKVAWDAPVRLARGSVQQLPRCPRATVRRPDLLEAGAAATASFLGTHNSILYTITQIDAMSIGRRPGMALNFEKWNGTYNTGRLCLSFWHPRGGGRGARNGGAKTPASEEWRAAAQVNWRLEGPPESVSSRGEVFSGRDVHRGAAATAQALLIPPHQTPPEGALPRKVAMPSQANKRRTRDGVCCRATSSSAFR